MAAAGFHRAPAGLHYPMVVATTAGGSERSGSFDVPLLDDAPRRFVGRIIERLDPGDRARPGGGDPKRAPQGGGWRDGGDWDAGGSGDRGGDLGDGDW